MIDIRESVPLSDYTSWEVGGPAEFFCQPRNIEEVKEAISFAKSKNLKTTILGGGTNVLVSDSGIKGLVLVLRKLSGAAVTEGDGRIKISAMAGTSKSEVLKIFLKFKLAPALFLAGLPGDVGGGVVMNAGVGEDLRPREFVEIVDWVEVLRDGKLVQLQSQQLEWTYRHCKGWQPGIIVRVGLSWPNEPDASILEKVRAANQNRLSKQPLELPSCGSVFVNPPGHKAGKLIDDCGLKGFSIGGAQVSTKHANFIVNKGGATAKDISDVIRHVQRVVAEKAHVQLITEVIFLGEQI